MVDGAGLRRISFNGMFRCLSIFYPSCFTLLQRREVLLFMTYLFDNFKLHYRFIQQTCRAVVGFSFIAQTNKTHFCEENALVQLSSIEIFVHLFKFDLLFSKDDKIK